MQNLSNGLAIRGSWLCVHIFHWRFGVCLPFFVLFLCLCIFGPAIALLLTRYWPLTGESPGYSVAQGTLLRYSVAVYAVPDATLLTIVLVVTLLYVFGFYLWNILGDSCVFVCVRVCLSISLCACVWLSVGWSVGLLICLSSWLPAGCLSVYLSMPATLSVSLYLSLCFLAVCSSVCLFINLKRATILLSKPLNPHIHIKPRKCRLRHIKKS